MNDSTGKRLCTNFWPPLYEPCASPLQQAGQPMMAAAGTRAASSLADSPAMTAVQHVCSVGVAQLLSSHSAGIQAAQASI